MSPICPRCGDTLVEVWAHEHWTPFLSQKCSFIYSSSTQESPPTDGRESGGENERMAEVALRTSSEAKPPVPRAAANPVRRFFAGSCRKCGDYVYLAWEPNEHQFDRLLCTSCWMEAHPMEAMK